VEAFEEAEAAHELADMPDLDDEGTVQL
jgi:hypothetical protein